MASPARTLVGGVGHHDLCDHSLGPVVALALAAEDWPAEVRVEDLAYGAVHVVQRLRDFSPPLGRMVVVGAAARGGRAAGSLAAYEWDRALPDADLIQARVADALSGIVALDTLLIVSAALGAAPPTVLVVEVEPLAEGFGDGFSAPVRDALPRVRRMVRAIALDPRPGAGLPRAPLGGGTGGRA